jgi:mitochondrial enoyl-[acyl-carrier protein] reductase / trans-2-enoyl-CoA reductase
MQRVQIDHVGEAAKSLSLVTMDLPSPGAGQVLIEMQAATLNASDFLYISGQYFLTPTAGSGVGAEGVGRVIAIGPDTSAALAGRRVVLLPTYRHGTWATHTIAAETDVVVVPEDLDTAQLAMLGINPMTALRLLRDFGNPYVPDRWIGQTAGNSAVGEYLVKLAKHFGYKTLSIVRRDAAAKDVLDWGGDHALIDGPDRDSELATILATRQLDIVVDSIGGPASTALGHHLRFGGTLVTYAYLSGQPPTVSLLDMIGNHAHLTGFWLINWLRRAQPSQVQAAYTELVDLVADGTLSARVHRTLDITEWPEAVRLAQGGSRDGKILFTFADEHPTTQSPVHAAAPG